MNRSFWKAGHAPTLLSAFLYFDVSFMVWYLLGPLQVQIAQALALDTQQRALMVAVPILCGAVLRLFLGLLADRIGAKRTGVIAQVVVIVALLAAWRLGVHSFGQVLLLGAMLGVAGASFAVALPLASRWYPPEHQGLALGIAGAGNSGTALAALFAPGLAQTFGWTNVIGLAVLPLAVAFVVYLIFAKDAPNPDGAHAFIDFMVSPDFYVKWDTDVGAPASASRPMASWASRIASSWAGERRWAARPAASASIPVRISNTSMIEEIRAWSMAKGGGSASGSSTKTPAPWRGCTSPSRRPLSKSS